MVDMGRFAHVKVSLCLHYIYRESVWPVKYSESSYNQ